MSILLLLSAFTPAVPATIPLAQAVEADAMPLAPSVLPETIRLQIVGGEGRRQFGPIRSYHFGWWTAPLPSGGLCERSYYWTEAKNPELHGDAAPPGARLTLEPLQHRLQFALPGGSGCENPSGYISPMPRSTAAAIEALEHLRYAMALARGSGPLPFEVTCREEPSAVTYCRDPRHALASLPLERLGGSVEFESGRQREISSERIGSGSRVRMVQSLPGTLEEPATATLGFGPGNGDPLSWRVTLDVKQGVLAAVRIGRTTIIYH